MFSPIQKLNRWCRLGLLGAAGFFLLIGCDVELPVEIPSSPDQDTGDSPGFVIDPSWPVGAGPLEDLSNTETVTAGSSADLSVGAVHVELSEGCLSEGAQVTLSLVDPVYLTFRVDAEQVSLRSTMKLTVTDLELKTRNGVDSLTFFHSSEGEWVAVPTERDGSTIHGYADAFGEFTVGRLGPNGRMVGSTRWLEALGTRKAHVKADSGAVLGHHRYKVHVPPGALDRDTDITVTVADGGLVVFDLEPHGLQFRKPVTLEVDLEGANLGGYGDWTIWWYNDATGRWEDQGGRFQNGVISTQIHHFSRWGAGRGGW